MIKLFCIAICSCIVTTLLSQSETINEKYSHEEGFCSSTFILYKNKTFCLESGCEASSYIMFGTWKQKKDTIQFFPENFKNFQLVKNIKMTKTITDSIRVTILDKEGINITEEVQVIQYINGIHPLYADSSKTYKTDLKLKDCVLLSRTFYRLFKQIIKVKADSCNDYTITLNVYKAWLPFIHSSLTKSDQNFALIKTNYKLIDTLLSPNREGKLEFAEFLKQ